MLHKSQIFYNVYKTITDVGQVCMALKTKERLKTYHLPANLGCLKRDLLEPELPADSKQMLFSFRPFLNNFTLDNSNHVFSAWQVQKTSELLAVRNIEFISKQLCILCLFLSVQFKYIFQRCILIKLCCLIIFFKRILWISLLAYEVKCAWYFHEIQFWDSLLS